MDERTGDAALREELLGLETALARRDAAAIPGGYEAVLHDDFREHGASGHVWTREATLAMLAGATPADVELAGFEIEWITADVVLATYETAGARPSRRVSIWVRDGDRWRLRFHQGTPR